MASATNELLAAIHQQLGADAVLSGLLAGAVLQDRRLERPRVPCLLVGAIEERDYGSDGDGGEGNEEGGTCEILFSLEAWSAEGRRQASEIAERVRARLDRAGLTLSTRILVDLQHRATVSRREAKTALFVAELRFRAVVA